MSTSKFIALILCLSFCLCLFAGCNNNEKPSNENGSQNNNAVACTDHIDEDGDNICDNCTHPMDTVCTAHIDEDQDNLCDNCQANLAVSCSEHVDANGDTLCDTCGLMYTGSCPHHASYGVDNICDYCGSIVDDACGHKDVDQDGYCDLCAIIL